VPVQLETVKQALADRFEITHSLGKGGMSLVYAGKDLASGRDVAVKVLRPEFAVTILHERFHQEIAILSRLDHPNVLPLLESSESRSFVYYVMPFAHGGSLRTRLEREKRLSVHDSVAILTNVAAGLDYAHAQEVIHRDIKPENVMFDDGRAMICDFGVARAVVAAGGERISTSGLIVGTPTYMSPEQASGERELDHRSDVYSLACVLYEMLAGEPPFTGRTPQAVIARHVAEQPPSVRVVRPDIPQHVEDAILRALEKDPGRRWGSSGELAGALTE
jgi:serine/threonine-protein kinase